LPFEHHRLNQAGKPKLADKVEHISKTKGDGAGYDILSFELDGKERFIEVKTTAFAKETPFYASRNEIEFSRYSANQYYLYRLFEFRKTAKAFQLQGDIAAHCRLDPVSYLCFIN